MVTLPIGAKSEGQYKVLSWLLSTATPRYIMFVCIKTYKILRAKPTSSLIFHYCKFFWPRKIVSRFVSWIVDAIVTKIYDWSKSYNLQRFLFRRECGSTGVIPRHHRKPVWKSVFVDSAILKVGTSSSYGSVWTATTILTFMRTSTYKSYSGDAKTDQLIEHIQMATDFVQQQIPSAEIVLLCDFNPITPTCQKNVSCEEICSKLRLCIWPDITGYHACPRCGGSKFFIVGPSADFSTEPRLRKRPIWLLRPFPYPDYSASHMLAAIGISYSGNFFVCNG